jgi:hypothetical protein
MTPPPTGRRGDRIDAAAYVLGGLAFIPLIGVPLGIAAIIWAIVSRKRGRGLVASLGVGGIAFTIVLYGGLFFFGFVQTGGIYDRLRGQFAQQQLYTLVQAVEFYRLQYGSYPQSLEQLQATLPKQSVVITIDPTGFRLGSLPRRFYYQRVGTDHYYLRGVGPDDQSFTADDILPDVTIAPNSKIGLLLDKPSC